MSYDTSSNESFAVKDSVKFPIPLEPIINQWAKEGTIPQRVCAILSLCVEAETGHVVRYGSVMHHEIHDFAYAILNPKKEKLK
jgi:hypothetical protein